MLDVKCFLEDIQNCGDLDLTTETLLREMIERVKKSTRIEILISAQ